MSDDASHLEATARRYGWEVTRERDGSLRLCLLDWTVRVVFSHDGAFRYGRASGPGSTDVELGLTDVLDALEEYGSLVPPEQP